MKIQTSVRVDDNLYKEARNIFTKFGLTFGDAVNIFFSQSGHGKSYPVRP